MKLSRREAKVRVSRTVAGSSTDSESKLYVKTFVTHPAQASVSYGRVINLGNYESARITVGVSIPCYNEELTDALAYAEKVATATIQRNLEELYGEGGSDNC